MLVTTIKAEVAAFLEQHMPDAPGLSSATTGRLKQEWGIGLSKLESPRSEQKALRSCLG